MPIFEATKSVETRYAAAMSAVLEEIERFKQGLPSLLKDLGGDESPPLLVIGLSEFRRQTRAPAVQK
jgi:hypothetical protein